LHRREKMQKPLDIKKRKADHIVTNNSSLSALRGQVAHLVSRVLGMDSSRS
jgi:dephospho-CoA kinase